MKRTATAPTAIAAGIAAPRVGATILRRRPPRVTPQPPAAQDSGSCARVRQRRDQRVLAAQLGLLGERPHGGKPARAGTVSVFRAGMGRYLADLSVKNSPLSCGDSSGAGGTRTCDQRITGRLVRRVAVVACLLLCQGVSTATTFRLQVAALHRAGQTVREQLGEPCRILECAAFGEKRCAVEQFGGLSDRRIVTAVLCAWRRPVTSG